jgi:hypothetical protein
MIGPKRSTSSRHAGGKEAADRYALRATDKTVPAARGQYIAGGAHPAGLEYSRVGKGALMGARASLAKANSALHS